MKNTEIELKLETHQAGLRKIKGCDFIRNHKVGRGQNRRLISCYYDTPNTDLRQAGVSLRIRKEGATFTQTLKTDKKMDGAILKRTEWHTGLIEHKLSIHALQDTPIAEILSEDDMAQLAPAFTTDLNRTTYRLAGDNWEIELTAESGRILVNDAPQSSFFEIELELISGNDQHIYAAAHALAQSAHVWMNPITKADRGYACIGYSAAPLPMHAPAIKLKKKAPIGDSIKSMLQSGFAQLMGNIKGVLETDDPEAVHQMRVSVRRIKSILSLFKGILDAPTADVLRGELSWLMAQLGNVRDRDVLHLETLPAIHDAMQATLPCAAKPTTTPHILRHITQERQQYVQHCRTAIQSSRFTQLVLTLSAFIHTENWHTAAALQHPTKTYATDLLAKRYQKICKLGASLQGSAPQHKHALRLHIKKLRYITDFVASVFKTETTTAFQSTLKHLQMHFGELNDLEVARRIIMDIGNPENTHIPPALAWECGLLAGWISATIPTTAQKCEQDWQGFTNLRPYWKACPPP